MSKQTALERIDALAFDGKLPSYEELENALLQALEERKFFSESTSDMTAWLAKLVAAHVAGDSEKVTVTLNQFIQRRVLLSPMLTFESLVH